MRRGDPTIRAVCALFDGVDVALAWLMIVVVAGHAAMAIGLARHDGGALLSRMRRRRSRQVHAA